MNRKFIMFVLFQLTMLSDTFAQTLVDRLKNGIGSHASAIMSSYDSKNALSLLSNPAWLSYDRTHIDAAQISLLEKAGSLSFGVVVPVEDGLAIGFAFNRISCQKAFSPFAVGGSLSKVKFSEHLYIFSIGRNFRKGLSIGFNMKAVQQRIAGPVSNLVPGTDIGFSYCLHNLEMLDQTVISAAVENLLQPEIEIGAESVLLPRFYRLGIEKPLQVSDKKIVAIANMNYSEISGIKYRIGIEYSVRGFGTATIGWEAKQRLCMGGKVNFGNFQVSFAQIYSSNAGYYSLSLGYSIGAIAF